MTGTRTGAGPTAGDGGAGSAPRAPLALVTGASSGIGAAFARELARRGSDLVVVARSRDVLVALAGELPVAVEVVVADLADLGELERLERLVADRRPDLLVNCAATARYAALVDQEPEELTATVVVNALAPLRLTGAALRAGTRGVVNVSSTASDAANPLLAPYAASKAFLDSWTASVSTTLDEGRSRPVITVVRPGFSRTAFHHRIGEDVSGVPDRFWQRPEDVARRALDAHEHGRRRITLESPGARAIPGRRLVNRLVRQARATAAQVRTARRRRNSPPARLRPPAAGGAPVTRS